MASWDRSSLHGGAPNESITAVFILLHTRGGGHCDGLSHLSLVICCDSIQITARESKLSVWG